MWGFCNLSMDIIFVRLTDFIPGDHRDFRRSICFCANLRYQLELYCLDCRLDTFVPFEKLKDRLTVHIAQLAAEFSGYTAKQIFEMKGDRPDEMHGVAFIAIKANDIMTEKVFEAFINQGLYIFPVGRLGQHFGKACHIYIGMWLIIYSPEDIFFSEFILALHVLMSGLRELFV